MGDAEYRSAQYLLSRDAGPQWTVFLGVLADELNAQMPASELRAFFRALGQRLGVRMPLDAADSLRAMEASINTRLGQIGWGWVAIADAGKHLEITHGCAPVKQAFGEVALPWAGALLEGLHARWLSQLGAGTELELRETGTAEAPFEIFRFRLARAGAAF